MALLQANNDDNRYADAYECGGNDDKDDNGDYDGGDGGDGGGDSDGGRDDER